MRITISGPPGSGKTTVAQKLSERLGIELLTGGMIFRNYAMNLGVSLSEMGERAERDDEFDRKLDNYQLEILKSKENIILESRLSGWICKLYGVEAFKVFINAKMDIRIGRIKSSLNERKDEQNGDIVKLVKEREESEWKRYNKYYNIDFNDVSIYDVVIDSSEKSPDEIAGVIIHALDIWERAKRKVY